MTDEAVAEVKPLSEIFGGKPEPKAEPVKVEDQKPADPADDGKGDKAGETPAPKAEEKKPDAEQQQPKKDDPIKAMRKALSATQRELQQLRNERQQKEQQSQAPDPIADAEGFAKHIDHTVSERLWQERLADSQEDLAEKLGDAYEETVETFVQMMEANPPLYKEWRNSRNPGKFLMKAVEDHRTKQEIGDPAKFADRIRAETRKEMMSEMEKMVAEGVKKALGQRLPQSLADEQTQGGARADEQPAEFRRKPLDSILSQKR